MTGTRRWSDLSEESRRKIVVGGVIEAVLKTLALRDLARRPAEQVRGPKWLWATVIVLINGFGLAPVVYLIVGRRSRS